MSVFPILATPNGKSEYTLLQPALKKEQAVVKEVSEEGSIPDLMVINRASTPLLIPEGEILVGGKQNRTVNITVIIEAGEERVIPVSCVERGRWRRGADTFFSKSYAPPNLRTRKTASVQQNRATGGKV